MDIDLSCCKRRIRKVDVETPLLVPSFSSTIYDEDLNKIYEQLSEQLNESSLVSAFDLYYKKIDKESLIHSDLIFIDSGNYEIEYFKDNSINKIKSWSVEKYVGVLDKLKPLNKICIVNYDEKVKIEDQFSSSKIILDKYDKYGFCFLYKPTLGSGLKIDSKKLLENIKKIEQFDILGLTEKELGNSILERCSNIVKIREEMIMKHIEIPIHIFGCLDPLTVVPYFICGADIFDGLNWLKFSFYKGERLYTQIIIQS